jgi:hypothetical protein
MRYIAKTTAFIVVLLFLIPSIVLAEDYIADAVQALQQAHVYIAPGTEGTDIDTLSKLQARLISDDTIVLVMLPATAEKELGSDISTIVVRLSEELGNQRIIGLAVGKKVVGYAPTLPSGVAVDQMRRAISVSNDPVTALGTFAQNIHIWQAKNPQPTPILPQSAKKSSSGIIWPIILGSIVSSMLATLFLLHIRANQEQREKTHFNVPYSFRNLLSEIVQKREQVIDGQLQQALYQLCLDIEQYFNASTNDKERDALFFHERLTEVNKVLIKYIDVQQHPRYYYNPEDELRRGKESIIDFSQYVLESIRRGNAVNLLDYTVNTKILQAQRYR